MEVKSRFKGISNQKSAEGVDAETKPVSRHASQCVAENMAQAPQHRILENLNWN